MGIGLILLLTFAISGLRRVVNTIWLIIIAVVLGVIALVWFGFALMREQSKPAAVAETPTPAFEMDDYN
jgi:threonine/homoserine/homoserine lactone efflux protein